MYDVAIVGAGINGCSVAYEFLCAGKSVVVFDKEGVASGGSGAAGAFISPKFSKAGELKEIIEEAFLYSMEYYKKNFPGCFTTAPLVHIAKDAKDDAILEVFKEKSTLPLREPDAEILKSLTQEARKRSCVSLDAGVVDAQKVCKEMIQAAEFVLLDVQEVVYKDGHWLIENKYRAKELVLATGAYKKIIPEEYILLRGVWGHRVDLQCSFENPCSVHQFVSISPSREGQLAVGATHNVHYHPEINTEAYDIQEGREELLQKAAQTLTLGDVKILKDYTGLRSGSYDYMPLLGSLVNAKETLACCEKNIRIKRPDFTKFVYHPHLFMINGSGGYGFVLAPYLAKILYAHIEKAVEISPRLSPARFFARWAKRRS